MFKPSPIWRPLPSAPGQRRVGGGGGEDATMPLAGGPIIEIELQGKSKDVSLDERKLMAHIRPTFSP